MQFHTLFDKIMGMDTLDHTPSHEWLQAFDAALDMAANHKPASQNSTLILHADYIQPVDVALQSEIEVWDLFIDGLNTLKRDRISGHYGDFTLACRKVSLRNTPLARSIGVKPPWFEFDGTDPAEKPDARAFIESLLNTAERDLHHSHALLTRALSEHKRPDTADQTLQQSLTEQQESIHQQMDIMLQCQVEAYNTVHGVLATGLTDIFD